MKDLRDKLAKAIKARDAQHDKHAGQYKAQQRAAALLAAAEARRTAAAVALDEARVAAARRIASAARSGLAAAPSAELHDARLELQSAEDDLAAAQHAYAECEPDPKNDEVQQRVEDAVDALLGSLVEPLLQVTEEAQARVLACRLRLRFLEHCIDRLDPAKAREINDFLSRAWQLVELSDVDKHAANQPLRDVRARLMRDSAVALPPP
jgi:hypothetical protein